MPDTTLRVKVPEGFQFYALYPEKYILAVQRWLQGARLIPNRPVLVVRLRSIGTTLSAVVAATLLQVAVRASRITVRPKGNPFQRHLEIPSASMQSASHALVVDEGPGLSGSSMAAAALALQPPG